MIQAKKIIVFLADGLPKGIRHAKIDQWSGKAVCGPRNKLKDLFNYPELISGAVIYFLIGDQTEAGLFQVYIGEADGFKQRIRDHDYKKDWWKDVVVFFSQDGSLSKAGIQYLEHICHDRLEKAGKCELKNNNKPGLPTLPEEDLSGLEIFYENITLIMPLLGFDIFVQKQLPLDNSKMLYITRKGICAKGILLADGKLRVMKDSEAVISDTTSFKNYHYYRLKEALKEKNRLIKKGEKLIFTDDYDFDSSSAAAAIILANPSSGPIEWKDKNGITLKSILEPK